MPNIKMPLEYRVDVRAPLTIQPLVTLLMEGDAQANELRVSLFDGEKPLDLSGLSVGGSFTRADGAEVPITGSVEGNVVEAALDEYCYAVPGPFGLYVQLLDSLGGVKRTVLLMAGYVHERGHGPVIDTGIALPSLDGILAQLETMKNVTNAANQAASGANAAAGNANEAASAANRAAGTANAAATNADAAAGRANEAAGKWNESSAEKLGQRIDNLVGSDPQTVKNTDMFGGKPSGWYHQDYYEGINLKTVFASADDLAASVRAGDFSKIRVGDYWPITLDGTIYDYAEAANKTLSNAIIKLEVAGVNFYSQYGDTGVPQNHLLLCSRDLLPMALKFRSENTTWHDAAATNPWLGSHLYQTLNDPSNGILPLVVATDIGAYIYARPNGKGMRFLGETKGPTATTATSWAWANRGKLFLPSEHEVWGGDVWSEHSYGGGLTLQWPIFAGTMRHIIKGLGNGGNRHSWWCCSSRAGSTSGICYVANHGVPADINASTSAGAPICFLIA